MFVLKGKEDERQAELKKQGEMAGIRMDIAIKCLLAKLGAPSGARLGDESDVAKAVATADMIMEHAGMVRKKEALFDKDMLAMRAEVS
jgi:hypothetical protein